MKLRGWSGIMCSVNYKESEGMIGILIGILLALLAYWVCIAVGLPLSSLSLRLSSSCLQAWVTVAVGMAAVEDSKGGSG